MTPYSVMGSRNLSIVALDVLFIIYYLRLSPIGKSDENDDGI